MASLISFLVLGLEPNSVLMFQLELSLLSVKFEVNTLIICHLYMYFFTVLYLTLIIIIIGGDHELGWNIRHLTVELLCLIVAM